MTLPAVITTSRRSLGLQPAPINSRSGDEDNSRTSGTLILIGGAEDKIGPCIVLKTVVKYALGGPLVVATLASDEPEVLWEVYSKLFGEFGIEDVRHLPGVTRGHLLDENTAAVLDNARAVFFTGGDQLKITTNLGGTTAYERIRNIYKKNGGVIAGTSAGAAAMGQVMLMSPEAVGPERH